MKSLILATIAFSAAVATAGGLDAKQYNYEDVKNFPKAATRCVDGTKQQFVEEVPGLDKTVLATRVCVDGAYYKRTSTKGKACKNGAVAFWNTSNPINDNAATARYVCVNGKYIRQ